MKQWQSLSPSVQSKPRPVTANQIYNVAKSQDGTDQPIKTASKNKYAIDTPKRILLAKVMLACGSLCSMYEKNKAKIETNGSATINPANTSFLSDSHDA
jgi:hypothetical protein